MRNRILIIEDCHRKSFTTKLVVETQLKISVKLRTAESLAELGSLTSDICASQIIFKPRGGIVELLALMKKRKLNRRNTEVFMLKVPEMEDQEAQMVAELLRPKKKNKSRQRNAVLALANG